MMMRPSPRRLRCGTAALVIRRVPNRLTSIVWRQSSRSASIERLGSCRRGRRCSRGCRRRPARPPPGRPAPGTVAVGDVAGARTAPAGRVASTSAATFSSLASVRPPSTMSAPFAGEGQRDVAAHARPDARHDGDLSFEQHRVSVLTGVGEPGSGRQPGTTSAPKRSIWSTSSSAERDRKRTCIWLTPMAA